MYIIAKYRISRAFKSILNLDFSPPKFVGRIGCPLLQCRISRGRYFLDFACTSPYSVVLTALLDLCTDISGTRPWQILRSSVRAERVQGTARSVEHDQRRNGFRRSSVAGSGTTRSAHIFPRGRQWFRLKYFCPSTNEITKF